MNAKDILVLNHAYSNEYLRTGSLRLKKLYRTFSSVYGQSILGHTGLRYAILASVAKAICTNNSDHLEYINCAFRELRHKLTDPKTLDEGDLFTSCLIAIAGESDLESRVINVRGFTAILQHLLQEARGAISSYQLAIFWPLARDLLEEMAATTGMDMDEVEPIRLMLGPKTFKSYHAYIDTLQCPEDGYKYKHKCGELWTISRLQYGELKKAIRLKAHRRSRDFGRYTSSRSAQTIQPILTHDAERVARATAIVTEEIDNIMSTISRKDILCSFKHRRLAVIYFLRLVNRMLCTIMQGSSIIGRLCSPEGIDIAFRLTFWIRSFGGALFLDLDDQKDGDGEALGGGYLNLLSELAANASKRFVDSIPNYLYPAFNQ